MEHLFYTEIESEHLAPIEPPQPLSYEGAYLLLGFSCFVIFYFWYAIAKAILDSHKKK
jgi:hypothetical protein